MEGEVEVHMSGARTGRAVAQAGSETMGGGERPETA